MLRTEPDALGTCLTDRYRQVRALTETLAAPLSAEDQTAQSMPDVSPTKWHRAHTSWFFETFVLEPFSGGYRPYDDRFAYLFNSYYETVGPFFPRAHRGVVTRPGIAEVTAYRAHVDEAVDDLLTAGAPAGADGRVELGCHHEQQHQELVLMDIKNVLAANPLGPAYMGSPPPAAGPNGARRAAGDHRVRHDGGLVEIGHDGFGFAFDNELPRHGVYLQPFELAEDLVSNGQWLEFMADGGYERPELWLSEGWAKVRAEGWDSPLYWHAADGGWRHYTLAGVRAVDPAEAVCHVSYFEADAFARWSGARLPTEAEWEVVAAGQPVEGRFLDPDRLHPGPAAGAASMFGDVWQWTSSSYAPYPGYRPGAGALGEYNGKFMANQYVLRGGSCVSPAGHLRATYRNYFPAGARWAFAGLRLARDL
ncbi:MAG TPA: ergothioneine biosynthesis protein EgtB [Acidimicrobiales bacterium]|nr:ergothioneine biosynthesis protein EgtB [Acidimicrobiales bacterium]